MDEQEALEHKIWFFEKIGFFEAEAAMSDRAIKKMRFDDLDPNDPVRRRAEGRDTGETELSGLVSQNFCSVCGVPVAHESNFCPNCGNPSKRLQVAAVEREQSERPALAYEMVGPQMVGRQNFVSLGITAEVYDDQSVTILTLHPVSVTFDRLGSEAMGAFEIRVTPAQGKEVRKAAAATSLVTPS